MEKCGARYGTMPKSKTKYHKSLNNPYWNTELENYWNMVCVKERKCLKCHGNNPSVKQKLEADYCVERKKFDPLHKKNKRHYQKHQITELDKKLELKQSRELLKYFVRIGIVNDKKNAKFQKK